MSSSILERQERNGLALYTGKTGAIWTYTDESGQEQEVPMGQYVLVLAETFIDVIGDLYAPSEEDDDEFWPEWWWLHQKDYPGKVWVCAWYWDVQEKWEELAKLAGKHQVRGAEWCSRPDKPPSHRLSDIARWLAWEFESDADLAYRLSTNAFYAPVQQARDRGRIPAFDEAAEQCAEICTLPARQIRKALQEYVQECERAQNAAWADWSRLGPEDENRHLAYGREAAYSEIIRKINKWTR